MANQSRPGTAIGAGYLTLVGLAAALLLAVGFEGTYIVVGLRAADEGLRAAAEAATLSIDVVGDYGYGVRQLRSVDGVTGPSALSAATQQLETRGVADRVRVVDLWLVDDVVVVTGECRLPAALGRLIGLSAYSFTLTALADAPP